MSLRDYINQARTTTPKRTRNEWTETDYQTALDLRLTGDEAGQVLGCTGRTINKERQEWSFE